VLTFTRLHPAIQFFASGVLFIVACVSVLAQEAQYPFGLTGLDETMQRDFVLYLLREKHYFEVTAEAHRFVFLFPESRYRLQVDIAAADALHGGGDERGALDQYRALLQDHPESPFGPEIQYRIGKVLALAGMYSESQSYFDTVVEELPPSSHLRDKSARWLLLDAMLGGTDRVTVENLLPRLDLLSDSVLRDQVDSYYVMNTKSPAVAGVLSGIVPGAGQLYLRRGRDALASILLNGLFVWGTWEAFRSDAIGLGVFLAILEAGWYAGNIYSAVNGAHKHNRRAADTYRNTYVHSFNLMSN